MRVNGADFGFLASKRQHVDFEPCLDGAESESLGSLNKRLTLEFYAIDPRTVGRAVVANDYFGAMNEEFAVICRN